MIAGPRDTGFSVSVVIAAYNADTTVGETLASLLEQTYQDWEAIIVDDGSTDNTRAVAGAFALRDKRIRVVTRPNGGEAAARNEGISRARYNWLLFLDADDWIAPSHLEIMTAALRADPTLDAVHCGWARVARDGTRIVESYRPPTGDLFPVLARRAAFAIHACVVRRTVVDLVGRFDTSLRKSPDWDLWQRIARSGAVFGAVEDVLAFYRMTPGSASLAAERMLQDGLTVLRRGHSADPRVPSPVSRYANGLSGETIETQEFYLLCWTAGLLFGSGEDARHLLSQMEGARYPELSADAVAQCIFDAGTLPSCEPSSAWDELWPRAAGHIETFLEALESQSQAPGLARSAMVQLKTRVLAASATWGPVIEHSEGAVRAHQARAAELEAELRGSIEEMLELRRQVENVALHAKGVPIELEQCRTLEFEPLDDPQLGTHLPEDVERSLALAYAQREELLALASSAQSRANALDREMELMRGALERAHNQASAVETQAANLQSSLRFAEQEAEELRQELDRTARLQAEMSRRINDLENIRQRMESELEELRRRAAEAERKNELLTEELEKWRRSATERAVLVDKLTRKRWLFLFAALGLVTAPDVTAASSRRLPPPDGSRQTVVAASEEGAPLWNLVVARGNEASIIYPDGDHHMAQVSISTSRTIDLWHIQISRPGLSCRAGKRRYLVGSLCAPIVREKFVRASAWLTNRGLTSAFTSRSR